MKESWVPYSEGGDRFDAFVCHPEGEGPRPAVLVCHAWAGRNALMEEKARALAELGYIGIAIDLYGVGVRGTDAASCEALMTGLTSRPELLARRARAAFDAARAVGGVDVERMGSIGFCFGGLVSLLLGRMGLPLRGVVSFHGLLKLGEPLETPVSSRFLVLHGQDDPMVPPEDVGRFAAEMKRINADWALESYAGVVHAFTNPEATDPSTGLAYSARADRRSWLAMTRFFEDVFGEAASS